RAISVVALDESARFRRKNTDEFCLSGRGDPPVPDETKKSGRITTSPDETRQVRTNHNKTGRILPGSQHSPSWQRPPDEVVREVAADAACRRPRLAYRVGNSGHTHPSLSDDTLPPCAPARRRRPVPCLVRFVQPRLWQGQQDQDRGRDQ